MRNALGLEAHDRVYAVALVAVTKSMSARAALDNVRRA